MLIFLITLLLMVFLIVFGAVVFYIIQRILKEDLKSSRWVKNDGLLIIGVYNTFGRLRTNLRQIIYKVLGKSKIARKIISIMDPYLRKNLSVEKKAWFRYQYEHFCFERKHTLDEVMKWFEENKIEYLGSIPSPNFEFQTINQMDGYKGTYFQRICTQISMLFSNLGGEGGMCILVGRKR